MNATRQRIRGKAVSAALIFVMVVTMVAFSPAAAPVNAGVTADSFAVSGYINAEDGAVLRARTRTDSDQTAIIADGQEVRIRREIFKEAGRTDPESRWYLAESCGYSGYLRADLVDGIKYTGLQGSMKRVANFRAGPSTGFEKIGRLDKGAGLTVLGYARVTGGKLWYKVSIDGQTGYINRKHVKVTGPEATISPSQAPAEQAAPAIAEPAAAEQTAPAIAEPAVAEQTAPAVAEPAAAEQTTPPAAEQTAPAASQAQSVTASGVSEPVQISKGGSFTVEGSLSSSSPMTKVVAGVTDTSGNWFITAEADVNSDTFDLGRLDSKLKFGVLTQGNYKYRVDVYFGDTVTTQINSDFEVIARTVTGGRENILGTFDSSNSTRLFAVTGSGSAKVPQGMTLNGDTYYMIFGMGGSQAIVTYSSSGVKLAEQKLPFNMGHPNGITWNPQTGLCYIFRGSSYKCFTWNPVSGEFGSAKTPYSSSGIAYDAQTGFLYASSRTGFREYSGDGQFSHRRLFARCSHSGKTHMQDCGASNGYIFHCISGSSKHTINYLDIYREKDGSYLGTFKINIDEAESAVVGSDGFIQILCNTSGPTDYVWKTPLNVSDLN